jgi:hypothetical protein
VLVSQVVLVVDTDGLAVNAVVLGQDWTPPDGMTIVVPADGAWIGWTLNADGSWTPPAESG